MKIEKTKDLAYYEALPYTIVVRKDEDGEFVAKIPELPGCVAHGETEGSAIEHLRSMQRLWLEDALGAGDTIPEPEDDSGLPSGKWLQRVPRRLHRDLVSTAKRDNISLNQLVTSLLSEALAVKSCANAFEATLARVSQSVHLVADISMYWGSVERMPEANRWSTTPYVHEGQLIQELSRVKNLRASDPPLFPDLHHAEALLERHKQLATK